LEEVIVVFSNLAGVAGCDLQISYELKRARIPIEQVEQPANSEVPYTLIGKLNGPYTFTRLWTYWAVEGLVPLSVAEELYADPVGRDDIRVAGHCGCPPPAEWAEWLTLDEELVLPAGEEKLAEKLAGLYAASASPQVIFSNDPESLDAKQFVTSYHIDSEVGLRVFVDTLFKHQLASEPKDPKPEPVAA
jgi:hypothetical protein